jgi:hypothetical protein
VHACRPAQTQWLLLGYFASMLAHLPATSPLQPTPSCGLHTVLCDNRDVVSVPNNSYANPIFPAALDIPAVLGSKPPLPSNTIRPHGDCERAHSVTVGALHSATCMGPSCTCTTLLAPALAHSFRCCYPISTQECHTTTRSAPTAQPPRHCCCST